VEKQAAMRSKAPPLLSSHGSAAALALSLACHWRKPQPCCKQRATPYLEITD